MNVRIRFQILRNNVFKAVLHGMFLKHALFDMSSHLQIFEFDYLFSGENYWVL